MVFKKSGELRDPYKGMISHRKRLYGSCLESGLGFDSWGGKWTKVKGLVLLWKDQEDSKGHFYHDIVHFKKKKLNV